MDGDRGSGVGGKGESARAGGDASRWLFGFLTLVLAAALATAAHGQATLDSRLDVGETTGVDTDYTPRAKPTTDWQLVAGAPFKKDKVIEESPTSFDTDLHDVAFKTRKLGLAAGTRCRQAPADPKQITAVCDKPGGRVPVIYEYEEKTTGEQIWRKVALPGEDQPGYVGAIAWISSTKALAVGGNGVYPRREQCADGTAFMIDGSTCADPAGLGRAWLYSDGKWSELDLSALHTGDKPIGGMTALDIKPGATPDAGFAGGLGQLWEWRDGGFIKRIDRDSPASEIYNRKLFLYRVREIRYAEVIDVNERSTLLSTAITAGCCSGNRVTDIARVLTLREGVWRASKVRTDATESADPERTRGTVNSAGWDSRNQGAPGFTNPDSSHPGQNTHPGRPAYCPVGAGQYNFTRPYTCVFEPLADASVSLRDGARWNVDASPCVPRYAPYVFGRTTPPVTPEACADLGSSTGSTNSDDPPSRADLGGESCHGDVGVPPIAPAPGVPIAPGNCASTPTQSAEAETGVHSTPLAEVPDTADPTLYTLRAVNEDQLVRESLYSFTGVADSFVGLLSPGGPEADGESASAFTNDANVVKAKLSTTRLVGKDANWSVGELRAEKAELGSMGLLFDANRPRGEPVTAPNVTEPDASYRPTSAERLYNYAAGNYYAAPSYALNAVEEINQTVWAVGDRGAILNLGAAAFAKSFPEPDPPVLGSREPAKLPDTSPYDAARPGGAAKPGLVPARSARPRPQLPSPRVALEGEMPLLSQIIMSPNGDEGWGIADGRLAGFFDGIRWHPCPADGRPAPKPRPQTHPQCIEATRGTPASIEKAVRVPLEKDSDPTNDDLLELAVFSVNTDHFNKPIQKIHRYRGGEGWRQDSVVPGSTWDSTWAIRDIAFVTPDDAWLLVDPCTGASRACGVLPDAASPNTILHYRDGAWRDCSATCDPAKRMPRQRWQGVLEGLEVAGDRIYGWGFWWTDSTPPDATPPYAEAAKKRVPFVIFRDPVTKSWNRSPVPGEYDPHYWPHRPGVPNDLPRPDAQKWQEHVGDITALTVTQTPTGAYEGWAVGVFGRPLTVATPAMTYATLGADLAQSEAERMLAGAAPFLRLGPGAGWEQSKQPIFEDHYSPFQQGATGLTSDTQKSTQFLVRQGMALDGRTGQAMIGGTGTYSGGHIFVFNRARDRWELEPSDRPQSAFSSAPHGNVGAVAPDGKGGFWMSIGERFHGGRMHHYTDRPEPPVFEDVPMPAGEHGRPITALAGTSNGTVWAATSSDVIYRYDRVLGWNRQRIPGWDPGRLVLAPSPVTSLAVNGAGEGVAVGPDGRIARLDQTSIGLDRAAGVACDIDAPAPPCGTTRDLRAAAVASDGSAMVGGDNLTLLWRPAGGEFRKIATPDAAATNAVTAISMPAPDRVWIGTSSAGGTGLLFAGKLDSAGRWIWEWDNVGVPAGPIGSLIVRPDGGGYGLAGEDVLDREPGREPSPWRKSGVSALAMAVPPGQGEGAIFGTRTGVSTLLDGRLEPAKTSWGDPGPITSLALVPGRSDGEVEAWASSRTRMFHHATEVGSDHLLDPTRDARALPDAPVRRAGELAVAAFGKTRCSSGNRCYEMSGSNEYSEVLSQRIVDALERRRPATAVFTGDSVDNPGYAGEAVAESAAGPGVANWPVEPGHNLALGLTVGASGSSGPGVSAHARKKLARWAELVADRLTDRGVPMMGAVGGRDLTGAALCQNSANCLDVKEAKAGENLAWRKAMGSRSKPWGNGPELGTTGLRFRRVADGPLAVKTEDTELDTRLPGTAKTNKTLPTGGAPTHYAVDVIDPSRRAQPRIARLVFLDNSAGSLASSDPLQRPLEPEGGQAAWLDRMLCTPRSKVPGQRACTRRPDQLAIVVANTPTYSYAPVKPNDIAADGAAVEASLIRHGANLMVSGRIGWNGVYWTRAPGLHEPCPGGEYQENPPGENMTACGGDTPAQASPEQAVTTLSSALAEAADDAPAAGFAVGQALGSAEGLRGAIPSLVASGAGGELLEANGAAKDGYWHGYTIARLDPSGDYRKTVIEQRPIYDWVGIEAQARVLKAGQKMMLRGFGRGPVAPREFSLTGTPPYRVDRLDGPAVTHRYSLVEAEPDRPWLPRESGDGAYAPLDPSIATVDSQSGALKVGRGNQPRTYAVAMLSVGCVPESPDQGTCEPDRAKGVHVATYPLVFEPRRTFKPQAAQAPPQSPRVVVQSAAAAAPAVPPTQVPPQVGGLTPPPLPNLTPPPPPATGPPAASPQAPPPPPPPPPPVVPAPLALASAPPGLTIAPPGAVIPPPAPPINPAPPGGARKEARQRQAATEKSGSDSGASEGAGENGGDLAQDRPGSSPSAMTRIDHSFTAVRASDQPSAWARGALYGGGLTLASLALAGLWTARPRPRPRPPAVPAPARAWARRR